MHQYPSQLSNRPTDCSIKLVFMQCLKAEYEQQIFNKFDFCVGFKLIIIFRATLAIYMLFLKLVLLLGIGLSK